MKGPQISQKVVTLPAKFYPDTELKNEDVESFLNIYNPEGCNNNDGEMQLKESKWRCRIDSGVYLKAIFLVVLIAIFTATLLVLFVKTTKEPAGEIYRETVLEYPSGGKTTGRKNSKQEKSGNCKAIAQEISGFNGCSVPDWMPKDLVNTHGKGLTNSLWKYWWSSSDKSEENYSQIFETDCNKHDICYGCGSVYNLTRADCDNLFHKDMKTTCEKRYSSSWLEVIQSSLGKAEYQDNQKDLCVQKAEQFRHGVEIGGEENFTGSEKWCKEPCVVEYLIGRHLIKPHYVNCGNGAKSNTCNKCSGTGDPNQWCSGDCKWNSWFEQCEEKEVAEDDFSF